MAVWPWFYGYGPMIMVLWLWFSGYGLMATLWLCTISMALWGRRYGDGAVAIAP